MGRLASRIALTLMGKHKPIFTAHHDVGDYVVVTNARRLFFTGKKLNQKGYYSHTGYPGGLKRISAKIMMERAPEMVLVKAVKGMLPKNNLRKGRLQRLKVFADESHPYEANISRSYEVMPQRLLGLGQLKIEQV